MGCEPGSKAELAGRWRAWHGAAKLRFEAGGFLEPGSDLVQGGAR